MLLIIKAVGCSWGMDQIEIFLKIDLNTKAPGNCTVMIYY